MSKLVFATNNKNKIEEVRAILGPAVQIIGLQEAGIEIDIPEPHDTLAANALEKARVIHSLTGLNCFSEDTGLEVESIGGEPGVLSARYAGADANNEQNIIKLLDKLKSRTDRRARFRTVLALIWNNTEYLFEGICEGQILESKRGNKGFGYDAVFMPAGSQLSFAEMDMAEKNRYSHRKKAVGQLVLFLQQHP